MKQLTLGIIALLALTTGCSTTTSLSGQMADWQGQNIGVAIGAWGQPDSEQAFGDESVLIWQDRAYQFLPGDVAPNWTSAAVVCERMLAITDDGTITGWRWRGDSCPTLYTPDAQVLAVSN
ncbi:MAG: hypothetical protein KJO82_09535 [Gammaproteobacteria bacterium]|nr:hypothetical protein [Gammaproteobacteria bacterium]